MWAWVERDVDILLEMRYLAGLLGARKATDDLVDK